MKVHELIKKLGEFDPEAEVIIPNEDWGDDYAGNVYDMPYMVSKKTGSIVNDNYRGPTETKQGVVIDV